MIRKNLNVESLYRNIRSTFHDIPEHRKNTRNIKISLTDTLMSGLAVFALKFPSLLQFDKARNDDIRLSNLKNLFSLKNVPSDTQMRDILDPVNPENIRPAFRKIFKELQRGKELEKFQYIDGHYLLALDGTGIFASSTVNCSHCIEKNHQNGDKSYYHQLLGASLVHPDIKQVIPLCPEPILNQDGAKKQDSERVATKRWLKKFRQDHSKLKAIVIEDALASNGPHIRELEKRDLRYILGVKEKSNKSLFDQFEINKKHDLIEQYEYHQIIGEKVKKKVTHRFDFINGLSLNTANPDIKVNFVDYTETIEYINPKDDKKNIGTKVKHFTWITDLKVSKDNVARIMMAGRSRWSIENENFKTLKAETGYNIEHSYGHGKKNLSTNLAYLTVLSFLVDQVLEIVCNKFNKALDRVSGTKRELWSRMKHWVVEVVFPTWTDFIAFLSGEKKLIMSTS